MVLCLIILLHAQLVQQILITLSQGRSKSLTNLDAIGVTANDDMESSSETDNDMLDVPNSARRRRRKLSSAGKVSGTEFFTAVFEVWGDEWEDLVPAVRGTCLREAISSVCERRGVDIDSIDVFLDNNKTPLPLLTSETSWLGGRTLKIRGDPENIDRCKITSHHVKIYRKGRVPIPSERRRKGLHHRANQSKNISGKKYSLVVTLSGSSQWEPKIGE